MKQEISREYLMRKAIPIELPLGNRLSLSPVPEGRAFPRKPGLDTREFSSEPKSEPPRLLGSTLLVGR